MIGEGRLTPSFPDCRGQPNAPPGYGGRCGRIMSAEENSVTNKTAEEERIQKQQEARDKEKERKEGAEERRLE